MDLIPVNFVIGLVIASACLSLLRCLSKDIEHAHAVTDLTNEVTRMRANYLAKLRGEEEPGEIIILDEDNP